MRCHLAPFFGDRPVDRIDADDIADLISALRPRGSAPKTIRNVIGTLSALFNFAKAPRRRWATPEPVRRRRATGDPRVRRDPVPDLRRA